MKCIAKVGQKNLLSHRKMKSAFLVIILLLVGASPLLAQHSLMLRVIEAVDNSPIEGVSVTLDSLTGMTDSTGFILFPDHKAGTFEIKLSSVGYFKKKITTTLPQKKGDTLEVKLQTSQEEIQEVVVVSTRTKQNIDALPTRVEVISQDEVEERSADKPSDISHAVKEQPGVQVQRTSANSGTFNIRLQGLRGKYVQILKDGFPLFGGLSQNLGVAQIPPLDLRQIEIIKGPASTLYGGDAIAGVINLISKEPSEQPEYTVLFNVENTKSIDAGFYAAQKVKWFGYSLIGQYRNQQPYDWNKDNFSDVPQLDRWSISPQLFFDISTKAKLNVGFNYAGEKRQGGAMPAVMHQRDTLYDYLEVNKSYRYGGNLKFEYNFGLKGSITIRNSINLFERDLTIYNYQFAGQQFSTATEAHYHLHLKKHDLVVGLDFKTDKFTETDTTMPNRNYQFLTAGLFIQELFTINPNTAIEGGMRVDYNQRYHFFALPHFAWMQKWSDSFRSKFNFGMGYKLPTVFQDEAEEANFRRVIPIADSVKAELSIGGTFDITVKPNLKNGWQVQFSEMFFYTRIFNPLIVDTAHNHIGYYNGNGYIQGLGLETSLKLGYRGANLFVTYTLQDQSREINGVKSIAPLTSKHTLAMLVSYEWHGRFIIGLDAYYWSPQQFSDGTSTHDIWEMGMNAQVIFKWGNFFANFENILDVRQSKYGSIVTPSPTYHNPRFAEIYGPLEGRIINVGFKLKLAAFIKKKK